MKVLGDEVTNSATRRLLQDGDPNSLAYSLSDPLDDRFRKLERDDLIESLLNEIKGRPTQNQLKLKELNRDLGGIRQKSMWPRTEGTYTGPRSRL